MKTETYDRIINNIKNINIGIAILTIFLTISFGIMFGINYMLSWILNIEISNWIYYSIPFIFSIPTTFIIWASANSHDFYRVPLRDFWIIFGVFVDITIENNEFEKRQDIEKWMNKNTTSLCRFIGCSGTSYTYAFLSKSDAMAFKLANV